MIKYNSVKDIEEIFDLLNRNSLNYILLRNLDKELPDKLPLKKDIDLIISPKDKNKFSSLLKNDGWKKRFHPFGNFPFLYGMHHFEFYTKKDISLDICYDLACRSLNKGEWFPLDLKIQESVWINKRDVSNKPWKFRLSYEDEFIHLITRCIFDKKVFTKAYITRIKELKERVNWDKLLQGFELIFFNFSETLRDLIEADSYEIIIKNYYQFKNY